MSQKYNYLDYCFYLIDLGSFKRSKLKLLNAKLNKDVILLKTRNLVAPFATLPPPFFKGSAPALQFLISAPSYTMKHTDKIWEQKHGNLKKNKANATFPGDLAT